MTKKKHKHLPVYRTDLLPSNLTASKKAQVLELIRAYRKGAVLLGHEQWRLFFETGRFNKNYDVDKTTFVSVIGAANRVQICRWQVVGQLQSWISNRANEFRDTVKYSTLNDDIKHMLHTINRTGTWFFRGDVVIRDTGEIIPPEVRKLARTIMRHIMSKHNRPDLSRISMRLHFKVAKLEKPTKAKQGGKVGYWINLSTMQKYKKIAVPLLNYEYHNKRSGRIIDGIQINERDGELTFGVVTDMSEVYAKSRAEYDGHGTIALDFGLSTLFATNEGQLLGQDWLKQLKRYDAQITKIAASQQRAGRKPRDSKRYRAWVQDMRGYISTEIGRVMNKLVVQGKPKELVLERLDFRNPSLSPRLNAILQSCGRSIIRAKLKDFEEKYGIKSTEVNPAYTSQTCSSCGYVDKRNRRDQKTFECLWCGHKQHADLNAAANIEARRARPNGWLFQRKAAVLTNLVRDFGERRIRAYRSCRSGSRGTPADPRLTNPYFNEVLPGVVRLRGRCEASIKLALT
jgi:putative transposase